MTPAVVDPPASAAPAAAPAATPAPAASAPAAAPASTETKPAETAAPAPVVYEFKDAKGVAAAPEHATELTALATKHKLSPAQASELYQRDVAREAALNARMEGIWNEALAKNLAASKADPVIGGDKFDATVARAQVISDKYRIQGYPSIWEAAVEMGVQHAPGFLRFMHAIDEGQRESGTPIGAGTTVALSDAEREALDYPNTAKAKAAS